MQSAAMSFPPVVYDGCYAESYDSAMIAAQSREMVKQHAKQRQVNIAAELSAVTSEEYKDDILVAMEEMEIATLPDVASIDIQAEIKWFMRPYLLDFLIEAHAAFNLLPETLFLTINLLDRYCSKRIVYRKHYQLIGCAALLVAAKYGDNKNKVPTILELKSMCCNLYEEENFIEMERHLLSTLEFVIGHPTVDSFLQIYMADSPYNESVLEQMALYISEMAMYHKEFVGTLPSAIARSALTLARIVLNRGSLSPLPYWSEQDSVTVVALYKILNCPSPVLARKYVTNQYHLVAVLLEEFLASRVSINKTHAPPTPPRKAAMAPPPVPAATHETPSKRRCAMGAPNGYITPPYTPVGGHGAWSQGRKRDVSMLAPNHCPPTPSPLRRSIRIVPQWQQYTGGAF